MGQKFLVYAIVHFILWIFLFGTLVTILNLLLTNLTLAYNQICSISTISSPKFVLVRQKLGKWLSWLCVIYIICSISPAPNDPFISLPSPWGWAPGSHYEKYDPTLQVKLLFSLWCWPQYGGWNLHEDLGAEETNGKRKTRMKQHREKQLHYEFSGDSHFHHPLALSSLEFSWIPLNHEVLVILYYFLKLATISFSYQ